MATQLRRLSLTFRPEWEPMLDHLKRTQFYDATWGDLMRDLVDKGLQEVKKEMMERGEKI